jgi:MraZ protein
MRMQANLKKEVVLVGMLKGFEIWDKEKWEEEMKKCEENFEQISEMIAERMGF